jgi:hypothetical protein
VVEKDSTQEIKLQETQAQRVPQWRHRIHFGESKLRKNKSLCLLMVCLTTHFSSFILCFRFDLLGCVVSVCEGTRNIFDITCRGTTPSCNCARVKEGINKVPLTGGNRSGLTGYRSNRSGPVPAWAGTKPAQIQNSNLN